MQQRGITCITWLLWLTSLVTVPVPFFAVERGCEPVARLFVFAAATSETALTDPDFAARMFAGFFVIQAVAYAGLLYAGAGAIARRLSAIGSGSVRWGLLAAALAALLGLGLSDTFIMPFARSNTRGSLLDLFD